MSQGDEGYADDDLLGESQDEVIADKERSSTRRKPRGQGLGQVGFTIIVLLVILVGVAFGAWLASKGRPATTSSTAVAAPTDTMDPSASVDPQVRVLQLQDQIAADPNDVDARLELGVLYYQDVQDLEGAREQWEAVTQIDPNNETAWYDLGFYYLSVTPPDCASAQDAWNKVLTIDPTGDNASQIQSHMAGLMPEVCSSSVPTAPASTGG